MMLRGFKRVAIRLEGFRCEECGYDLSGNYMGDHCPECGTPVGDSLSDEKDPLQQQAVDVLVLGVVCVLFQVPILGLYFVGHVVRWHWLFIRDTRGRCDIQTSRWRAWSWAGCVAAMFGGLVNVAIIILIWPYTVAVWWRFIVQVWRLWFS